MRIITGRHFDSITSVRRLEPPCPRRWRRLVPFWACKCAEYTYLVYSHANYLSRLLSTALGDYTTVPLDVGRIIDENDFRVGQTTRIYNSALSTVTNHNLLYNHIALPEARRVLTAYYIQRFRNQVYVCYYPWWARVHNSDCPRRLFLCQA